MQGCFTDFKTTMDRPGDLLSPASDELSSTKAKSKVTVATGAVPASRDSKVFGVPSVRRGLSWGTGVFLLLLLQLYRYEWGVCSEQGALFDVRLDAHTGWVERYSASPHWLAHWTTTMAFTVSFVIDVFGYVYTIHQAKRNLRSILVFINGVSLVTYGFLVAGLIPATEDFAGRALYVPRYLQWSFTTPALVLLVGIMAGRSRRDAMALMVQHITTKTFNHVFLVFS